MKRLVLYAVVAALGVVSCSPGDATSSPSSAAVAAPATTEATTTTSEATTTEVVEVEADLAADVEAAYLRSYEVFTACYLTLPDCDVESEFAEVYTGGSFDRLTEAALQRQADGLVYESPDDPDHARTEVFDIEVGSSGDDASVSFCTYAGEKELLISPDGSRNPVGLNDTILVEWGDANLSLGDDGVWRIYDYTGGGSETVLSTEIDRLRSEGKICEESET